MFFKWVVQPPRENMNQIGSFEKTHLPPKVIITPGKMELNHVKWVEENRFIFRPSGRDLKLPGKTPNPDEGSWLQKLLVPPASAPVVGLSQWWR